MEATNVWRHKRLVVRGKKGTDDKTPDIPGFFTYGPKIYGGVFTATRIGCQGIGQGPKSDGVVGRAGPGRHGVVGLAKGADDSYDSVSAAPSGVYALSIGEANAVYAESKDDPGGLSAYPAIFATSSGVGIAAVGDPAITANGKVQGAAISASNGTGVAVFSPMGTGVSVAAAIGVDVIDAAQYGLRVKSDNVGIYVVSGEGIGVTGDSTSNYGGSFSSKKTGQLWLQPRPDTHPDDLDYSNAGALYVRTIRDPETDVIRAQLWFCTVTGTAGTAQWVQIA